MARKPSSSHRGRRTSGPISQGEGARRTSAARRAHDTNRSEAGRVRTSGNEQPQGQSRDATTGRSGRAKRRDEGVRTPDQQAKPRGRSDRTAGQRDGTGSRLAGQRDGDTNSENRRPSDREDSSGSGTTETGAVRQGMGRGHRRNFSQSDDDAISRGQSRDDRTSDAHDSHVNRRSRAMDNSMPPGRSSSRGIRSNRRFDW